MCLYRFRSIDVISCYRRFASQELPNPFVPFNPWISSVTVLYGSYKQEDLAVISHVKRKDFIVTLLQFTDKSVILVHSPFQFRTMLNSGSSFDGASCCYSTDRSLSVIAVNAGWFYEFQPTRSLAMGMIFHPLRQFYRCNIRCHLSGSFWPIW